MRQVDPENPMHGVREIFIRAREIPAGQERDAYLEKACAANSDLRKDVEALLEIANRTGGFVTQLRNPAHLLD